MFSLPCFRRTSSTSLLILTVLLSAQLTAREISIIAHRGNSSEAPENTLPAFQSAINIGADYIELDIHLTKDGVPVVCHDCLIGRTTDNSYPQLITDFTVGELKRFDAGRWFDTQFEGTTVPTLDEVLDLTRGRVGLMIEIKTGSASEENLAREVLRVIKKKNRLHPEVIIGSFSPEVLNWVRRIDPAQPIIAIVGDIHSIHRHRVNHPNVYAISDRLATPELIYTLKRSGKRVWVFTINDPSRMTELSFDGIDGFISDRPRSLGREVVKTANRASLSIR